MWDVYIVMYLKLIFYCALSTLIVILLYYADLYRISMEKRMKNIEFAVLLHGEGADMNVPFWKQISSRLMKYYNH